MTRLHDDLLKQIAKMIALESHETKPVIHININLDKCWQLFEDERDGAACSKDFFSRSGSPNGLSPASESQIKKDEEKHDS